MASRMDRYYSDSKSNRSSRNQELYDRVYNDYSDIDAIKTIKRSNEIDISKLRSVVKDRETYKKERKLKETMDRSNLKFDIKSNDSKDTPAYDILDIKPETVKDDIKKEVKNYDISEVLNKAKDEYEEDDKNRSLKDLEYTGLNSLNLHNKEYKNSEAELKDLIDSIHNTSKYNKLGDDIGLLDSLKADTMVGDATSIKRVLEEEKQEEKKDDTKELDKSFFTSTMDFSEVDFDEAKALKEAKKRKITVVVIILLVIVILVLCLYFFGVFDFITKK